MQTIDDLFVEFIEKLHLTTNQHEDAQTKYNGVCSCLARHFYDRELKEKDKFLFGSYKTKTCIRPLDKGSDVDVLFKLSQEEYEKYEDNPSGLLQEVRNALKETYPNTEEIHAWGKVVLVKFSDGHHNVEVLPALEQQDKTFKIPNTENGGSWEDFDPRKQVNDFLRSNEKTENLTRHLSQMIKSWKRQVATCKYKSYQIVEDVIDMLACSYPRGKNNENYDEIVLAFYTYILRRCNDDNIKSYIKTAHDRAVKAVQYRKDGKYIEASQEWVKVFGDKFPIATENEDSQNNVKHIIYAPKPYGF